MDFRKGAQAASELLHKLSKLWAHSRVAGGESTSAAPGRSCLLGGRMSSFPQTALGKLRHHPHPADPSLRRPHSVLHSQAQHSQAALSALRLPVSQGVGTFPATTAGPGFSRASQMRPSYH